MKHTPQHSFSHVLSGHFELSLFRKTLKVYSLSADGLGLSVQKSFRINEKNLLYIKSKTKQNKVGFPPSRITISLLSFVFASNGSFIHTLRLDPFDLFFFFSLSLSLARCTPKEKSINS